MRLHHVQVACPPGEENVARRFWVEGLGLTEATKPPELAARGGAWFRAHDDSGRVTLEVHVGVEEDPFVPARKAHPAIQLDSVEVLDEAGRRLADAGYDVRWGDRHTFPGYERLHVFDGHGNRVELLGQVTPG